MSIEYVIGVTKEDKLLVEEPSPPTQTPKDYLKNTRAESLFPTEKLKIITVEDSTSVSDGLTELIDNHILSVPVYDNKARRYKAFIDMLDFVCAIVSSGIGPSKDSFVNLIAGSQKLKKKNCGMIADSSQRNPFYPVQHDASIGTILDFMVKYKVHRIPIVNVDGELVSVITQSHLLSELYKNFSKFDIFSKRVQDIKLGYKNVISIRSDAKAIEGFKVIYSKKVSGVAVVDGSGKLVGNLSATDLRNVGGDINLISRVFWSVEEFLKWGPNGEQAMPKPIYCTPNATVGEAVEVLVRTRTHRIYVIDDSGLPIGVISLGDVLEAIQNSLGWGFHPVFDPLTKK